jgi:hypothetical protein
MKQTAMRQLSTWSSCGTVIVDVPISPGSTLPDDGSKFSWIKNNWPVILAVAAIVISVPDLITGKDK